MEERGDRERKKVRREQGTIFLPCNNAIYILQLL